VRFAPSLRDHPAAVYSIATGVYLLVLLWGPTAPRCANLIPILLIAALLVLGIELLRRQTAREFPDAQAGEAMERMRAWVDGHRGRSGRRRPRPAAAVGNGGARVSQLERLGLAARQRARSPMTNTGRRRGFLHG